MLVLRADPHTESLALAAALPGQSRVFLIAGLEYVSFTLRRGDLDTMLEAVRTVLAQRCP